MSVIVDIAPTSDRDLAIARVLDATPAQVYRAWTDGDVLKQWFAPAPFITTTADLDVRVGGSSLVVMQAPDGMDYPNRGIYLDVVLNERLVFTDAFDSAWIPSAKPFMVVTLTFEPSAEGTRYTARAHHWSVADRERHEAMGFHQGWAICADQLEAVARTL